MLNGQESHSLWPVVPEVSEQRGFLLLSIAFGVWLSVTLVTGGSTRRTPDRPVTKCNSLPRLNDAQAGRIEEIPGIGLHRAKRIVSFRRRHGPFRSFAELRKVNGIGPESVKAVKRYARLEPCGSD